MMDEINIKDNNCPICFNEIHSDNKYTTECNHEYCKDCLNNWFDKGKNTCPNCRRIIKYLNNETIHIRLINMDKSVVIERIRHPPNTVIVKKSLLSTLLGGYVLIIISMGCNIYLLTYDNC
jgi:hypothetical protein